MEQPRYILMKGNKKFICPDCGKKTFVPFVDTITGDQLPDNYGRCDREINCAYFSSPYKDGFNKPVTFNYTNPRPVKVAPKTLSYVNSEIFKQSRNSYHLNNFVQWLNTLFGNEITSELIARYHIGTSKHWPGANIFWQIDKQGNIRSGKIMLYNSVTGRRIKEPYKYITWVHKVLRLPDFELKQCLFGEQLLNQYPASSVGIVESEKTAIIASVYLPQLIWLATGSLNNLNAEKCKVLTGRKVILFPDLNAFDKWNTKRGELSKLIPGINLKISHLLQTKASEADKEKGLDLADYLLRFSHTEFTVKKEKNRSLTAIKPIIGNNEVGEKSENSEGLKTTFANSEPITTETDFKLFKEFVPLWDITELESYFNNIQPLNQSIVINSYSSISDVSSFIYTHIETLKRNNGNRIYKPYYDRLIDLKTILLK